MIKHFIWDPSDVFWYVTFASGSANEVYVKDGWEEIETR